MGQTFTTRQGDWLALPTISAPNQAAAIAVTGAAGATDLHSGRSQGIDAPNGRMIAIKNEGLVAAYVVLDSESGGTAASATNAVKIDPGQTVNAVLAPGYMSAGAFVFPQRYMKHIGDGGNTTLKWWISTNFQIAG